MKTMKDLVESMQNIIVEGEVGKFYHGSTHKIGSFVDEFVGQGNNQLGPGIYFSTDVHDALAYSGKDGFIYEVSINLRNDLNTTQKVNPRVCKALMMNTPDESAWTNWDENKNIAIKMALQNTLEISDNMLDALMTIWGDWYMQDEVMFVRELAKLGFDGSIYPNYNNSGSTWAVVYNPQSITINKIHNPTDFK